MISQPKRVGSVMRKQSDLGLMSVNLFVESTGIPHKAGLIAAKNTESMEDGIQGRYWSIGCWRKPYQESSKRHA